MFLLYLLFHGHSVCLTSPEAFLPECMKLPPPTLKNKYGEKEVLRTMQACPQG